MRTLQASMGRDQTASSSLHLSDQGSEFLMNNKIYVLEQINKDIYAVASDT
jgi:hypothetical protein